MNERAEVMELLPNGHCRLRLESGREVLAYMAGQLRHNNIKVLIGDVVMVKLDPFGGHATNRIIRRM